MLLNISESPVYVGIQFEVCFHRFADVGFVIFVYNVFHRCIFVIPYFRIFNPWSQQLKFDPDCIYIKKWVPELKKEDAHTIHHWYEQEKKSHYPSPIVDHSVEAKKTLGYYKKC